MTARKDGHTSDKLKTYNMKKKGFILTDKLMGGTLKRFSNDKVANISDGASQQIIMIAIAQDVYNFKKALSLVREINNKHEHFDLKIIYRKVEKKNIFQLIIKNITT